MPTIRIGTFNLENFDDKPNQAPSLATRIELMRPQLVRMRADILCLQEVNGQEQAGQPRQLLALQQLLAGTQYAGNTITSTRTTGNEVFDERNLVVVSPFPILAVQQIKNDKVAAPEYKRITAVPPDLTAKPFGWERPILHVALQLPTGQTLHVLNVHLKSKLPTDIPGQKKDQFTWNTATGWAEGAFLSALKRFGQAVELRIVISEIFDQDAHALIVICGDCNAEATDVEIQAVRGDVEDHNNEALAGRVMVLCESTVPASSRYSLFHQGRGVMLDHIVVSRALLAHYRGTEIHNELLHDESLAFRTDVKFPESDHAPVVATFDL